MQGSIANADETIQPTETVKWTTFSIQGRDGVVAVAKAIAAQDHNAAQKAMNDLETACHDCHDIFNPPQKADE